MKSLYLFLLTFSVSLYAQENSSDEFVRVPLGELLHNESQDTFLKRLKSRKLVLGEVDPNIAEIPFVTTRPIYRNEDGSLRVYNEPTYQKPQDTFATGYATVFFPLSIHKPGQVERSGKDREIFQIKSLRTEPRSYFLQSPPNVNAQEILVFIHGFNNDFTDSILQTAQITEDLGWRGLKNKRVIAYSWVSRGWLLAYVNDREFLDLEGERLYQYLSALIKANPKASINILAHSMGNEVTLRALNLLYEEVKDRPMRRVLKNIILAAPDVSADIFKSYMPRVSELGFKVTHYFSTKDIPISLSKYANWGARRAGGTPIFYPGLDSIDVDEINNKEVGLGHSYFSASPAILSDINTMLTNLFGLLLDPNFRSKNNWEEVETAEGIYWKIKQP